MGLGAIFKKIYAVAMAGALLPAMGGCAGLPQFDPGAADSARFAADRQQCARQADSYAASFPERDEPLDATGAEIVGTGLGNAMLRDKHRRKEFIRCMEEVGYPRKGSPQAKLDGIWCYSADQYLTPKTKDFGGLSHDEYLQKLYDELKYFLEHQTEIEQSCKKNVELLIKNTNIDDLPSLYPYINASHYDKFRKYCEPFKGQNGDQRISCRRVLLVPITINRVTRSFPLFYSFILSDRCPKKVCELQFAAEY